MTNHQFTVVIERDEDGRFVAICPALPGCYTEGASEQEAMEMIEDAVRLHVEGHLERGEPFGEEIATTKIRIAVWVSGFPLSPRDSSSRF